MKFGDRYEGHSWGGGGAVAPGGKGGNIHHNEYFGRQKLIFCSTNFKFLCQTKGNTIKCSDFLKFIISVRVDNSLITRPERQKT